MGDVGDRDCAAAETENKIAESVIAGPRITISSTPGWTRRPDSGGIAAAVRCALIRDVTSTCVKFRWLRPLSTATRHVLRALKDGYADADAHVCELPSTGPDLR